MGSKQEQIVVTGYLSNHNSEQDEADERRWRELGARVRTLCAEYEEDLGVMVDGGG